MSIKHISLWLKQPRHGNSGRICRTVAFVQVALVPWVVAAGCSGSKRMDWGDAGLGGTPGLEGSGGSANTDGSPNVSRGGATTNSTLRNTGGAPDTLTSGLGTTVIEAGGINGAATGPFACRRAIASGPVIAPGTTGKWGTTSAFAGGTFQYKDDPSSSAVNFTVDTKTTAGSVILTATIEPNGFSGYGVFFKDPEKCWDASKYSGIELTISGDLGGGTLILQAQTNNDYPIDAKTGKGSCTGSWSDGCKNNETTIDAALFTQTPTSVKIPFGSLQGGQPNPIEPSELLGIQWQVNCTAASPCSVSLTIGEVRFYE